MFSLIITIISIALVAALALATLYYGGSAFNKGSDGAAAARLINEGQQVNGAVTIFRADVSAAGGTSTITTLAGLKDADPAYLTQVPSSFIEADPQTALVVTTDAASAAVAISDGVCDEVNARAKHGAAGPADTTVGVYGCVKGDDTTTFNKFYFKL